MWRLRPKRLLYVEGGWADRILKNLFLFQLFLVPESICVCILCPLFSAPHDIHLGNAYENNKNAKITVKVGSKITFGSNGKGCFEFNSKTISNCSCPPLKSGVSDGMVVIVQHSTTEMISSLFIFFSTAYWIHSTWNHYYCRRATFLFV